MMTVSAFLYVGPQKVLHFSLFTPGVRPIDTIH